MDLNATGKSTSRARGRIAEVLADARASLKEPSRPFTPATLDHRTSLSSLSTLDKHGCNKLPYHPFFRCCDNGSDKFESF